LTAMTVALPTPSFDPSGFQSFGLRSFMAAPSGVIAEICPRSHSPPPRAAASFGVLKPRLNLLKPLHCLIHITARTSDAEAGPRIGRPGSRRESLLRDATAAASPLRDRAVRRRP